MLSHNQRELLTDAKNKIREAQMECENIDHPFYVWCDNAIFDIQDTLDD